MDSIVNSLIAIANGFITGVQHLLDPWIGLAVVLLVANLWLAVIEIEEIGRSSRKPKVRRH